MSPNRKDLDSDSPIPQRIGSFIRNQNVAEKSLALRQSSSDASLSASSQNIERHHKLKKRLLNATSMEELDLPKLTMTRFCMSAAILKARRSDKKRPKILLKVCASEHTSILQWEYVITKHLSHPNIRSLKFHPRRGLVVSYVQMEYLPGFDLFQALVDSDVGMILPGASKVKSQKNQNLNILLSPVQLMSRYVYVMECVLKALEYLHSLGIIHNDLKLENVIVNFNLFGLCWSKMREKTGEIAPTVKLIDFGLSWVEETEPRYSGSILYGCWEKLTSSPTINHSTDLFAFAILFYAVCTGNAPGDENVLVARMELSKTPQGKRETFRRYMSKVQSHVRQDRKSWLRYKCFADVFHACFQYNPKSRVEAKQLLTLPLFKKELDDLIVATV